VGGHLKAAVGGVLVDLLVDAGRAHVGGQGREAGGDPASGLPVPCLHEPDGPPVHLLGLLREIGVLAVLHLVVVGLGYLLADVGPDAGLLRGPGEGVHVVVALLDGGDPGVERLDARGQAEEVDVPGLDERLDGEEDAVEALGGDAVDPPDEDGRQVGVDVHEPGQDRPAGGVDDPIREVPLIQLPGQPDIDDAALVDGDGAVPDDAAARVHGVDGAAPDERVDQGCPRLDYSEGVTNSYRGALTLPAHAAR